MSPIRQLDWDEINEDHIARHGVSPREIDEMCVSDPLVRRGRRGAYLVYGQTLEGRYVFAVIEPKAVGIGRCVTARDMTNREKHNYRMRRRAR